MLALILSALLVALFLWGNWQVAGIPLIAAGLLLNCVVVVLNFAMPVSVDAAARAGLTPAELRLGDDPFHERHGPHTLLADLATRSRSRCPCSRRWSAPVMCSSPQAWRCCS